jgi:prevent-host-death family protein
MKPIQVAQNIVSLSDFKSKASKMLDRIRKTHRPLVITQNGKAAAVLISPDDFDQLTDKVHLAEQARQIAAIREGIKEADEGKFASGQKVAETFAKYGVDVDAD